MKKLCFYPLIGMVILGIFAFTPEKVPSSTRATKAVNDHKTRIKTEFDKKNLTLGNPIYMRIFKESSELELWIQNGNKYELFKTYPICYFSGELGPKKRLGDGQSPEGFYFVKPNQMNPWSSFHLSINIGYPNEYDRAHQYTGNYIMMHGNCVSIGCYAMTDPIIEEIWFISKSAFEGGQPFFRIHIFPFRMTLEKMNSYEKSDHYAFWQNLKTGYDYFQENKMPPNVMVQNKKYVFE